MNLIVATIMLIQKLHRTYNLLLYFKNLSKNLAQVFLNENTKTSNHRKSHQLSTKVGITWKRNLVVHRLTIQGVP